MILSGPNTLRRITALVIVSLCLSSLALSASQTGSTEDNKHQIARAVLQAELATRREKFLRAPNLSIENIASLGLERVAEGFDMTLLGPQEIRERAHSFVPVEYILFPAITMENDTALVRLSVVVEVDPCFGEYQRVETPFTYLAERIDGEWKARIIANRPTPFVFINTDKISRLIFR